MNGHPRRRATLRERLRTRRVLGALSVGVVLLGGVPAHGQSTTRSIALQDCHLAVDFLKEPDGQRMYREGWLPKSQQLEILAGWPEPTPGAASLTLWVFDCRRATIDGVFAGSMILSLSGIQIEGRPYGAVPTHSDNYLVWAQTNNAKISEALKAVGLPVSLVPRMRFAWRTTGGVTRVAVPWQGSPYSMTVGGDLDDAPHVHDNTFQHGRTYGVGPQAEFVVDPLVPKDWTCVPAVKASCIQVTTKPGSAMARFLGTAAQGLGADHKLIPQARLTLSRG